MSEKTPPLPPELGRLSTFLDTHTECLAESNSEFRIIALHATKHIFDWAIETERSSKSHLRTLLTMLTETAPPQTRSQARSTPTRRHRPGPIQKSAKKFDIRETPLPSLFIEDMNTDQIWQQLDLRAARVCENLQFLLSEDEDRVENACLDGESSENDESEDEDEDKDEEDVEEMDIDDESIWEELGDGGEEDDSSTEEGVVNLRDEISEDNEDNGPRNPTFGIIRGRKLTPSRSSSGERSDLDDGFFNLASFNAETSGEARAEISNRKPKPAPDEESTEESEIDLFGSVDDSVTEGVELFYNDFFEPPHRARHGSTKSSKVRFHEQVSVKKIKAVGKGMPVSIIDEDSDEEEENDSDNNNS